MTIKTLALTAGALILAAPMAFADQEGFVTTCSTDASDNLFTAEACGCIYSNLKEAGAFTDEQIATIGTLFTGSPGQARERLAAGSESDQNIGERLNEVEDAFDGCE